MEKVAGHCAGMDEVAAMLQQVKAWEERLESAFARKAPIKDIRDLVAGADKLGVAVPGELVEGMHGRLKHREWEDAGGEVAVDWSLPMSAVQQ